MISLDMCEQISPALSLINSVGWSRSFLSFP